jgi:hypothetical protein
VPAGAAKSGASTLAAPNTVRAQQRLASAQTQATNTAAAAAAPAATVKSIMSLFGSPPAQNQQTQTQQQH